LIQYGFLRFMRGRDKCRRWLFCHAEYPHDINWVDVLLSDISASGEMLDVSDLARN